MVVGDNELDVTVVEGTGGKIHEGYHRSPRVLSGADGAREPRPPVRKCARAHPHIYKTSDMTRRIRRNDTASLS